MATNEELWTLEQRIAIWKLYVDASLSSIPWGKMMRLTGKSLNAVRTEIWKIHGEGYWDRAGRLDVRYPGSRDSLPFTKQEDKILEDLSAGMRVEDWARLLGRNRTSVTDRMLYLVKDSRQRAGASPMFPELEEGG